MALPLADVALTPAARTPAASPRDWASLVASAEEAGRELEHSERVAFWAPHYGKTFQYWGYLAGTSWPTGADLAKERLAGRAEMTLEARFEHLRRTHDLEWFLVSNSDLVSDPDPALLAYLSSRYQVERSGQGWLAYRISFPNPAT